MGIEIITEAKLMELTGWSFVREGNTLLTDLWFEAAALRRFGSADEASVSWCAEHLRPPAQLDFRML